MTAGFALVGGLSGMVGSAGIAHAASFEPGDEAVVVDGALNLRKNPDLSAKVVEVLADGTELTVTDGPKSADNYTWYEVSLDGDDPDGWVAGEYLASPSSGDQFGNGDGVRVVDGRLNLREAAGTDADILRVLNDGDAGVITDGPVAKDGFTWYEIHSAGFGTGWVAGEFLVLDEAVTGCEGQGPCPATIVEGDTIEVVTDRLNFREDPSLSGDVITVLEEGDNGTFTGESEFADKIVWIQVETVNHGTGWVARQYVVKI
jgi:uncharacterized protein YgiM (DUF1202 family)